MDITSESFADGGRIAEDCAFCAPDPAGHVRLAANRNPALSWTEVPEGTRSLVLLCHDPDVPATPEGVNQDGSVVEADRPRTDFFHWVLVDLPGDAVGVQEGEFSDGVSARGKPGPAAGRGARQGVNDFTNWFAGDEDMSGSYFGYDGPCPPWNDERLHHYHFTLYAVDLARCPVGDAFTGADVLAAIDGHVLAEARITGTYTLNPGLL